MKTKPWPIVILALLQLMAPVTNILFSAWLHQISVVKYLSLFLETRTTLEIAEFFGIYTLTAASIFSVKSWSYPVFLSVMGWTFYRNYLSWVQHPEIFTLPLMLGVHAVNLFFVSYFLIPAVRAAYFNPRLRWWESKPRYKIDLVGHVSKSASLQVGSECKILDISEGGVLIKSAAQFALHESVTIKFSFFNLHFDLSGRVVHQGGSQFQGFGVQFQSLSRASKKQIRNLTQALALVGLQERSERPRWHQDLLNGPSTYLQPARAGCPRFRDHAPRLKKQNLKREKRLDWLATVVAFSFGRETLHIQFL